METGMTKSTRNLALTTLFVFASGPWLGCGSRGDQSDASGGGSAGTAIISEPAYSQSETDAFHPGSKIESARKGRLTQFGSITVSHPEETPTLEAANIVINPPDMMRLNLGTFDNEYITKTTFPFDYENDVAALKNLFALHGLDNVVKADMTDMEKLSALALYTNEFLEGGVEPGEGVKTGPSAFLITKNRREKGIGGGSDIHAALLCQLALSCGYTARIIGMHSWDEAGRPLLHDICEVYVNNMKKWVAFDPLNRAVYYIRNSYPLSALELHTALVEDRLREVSPVPGKGDLADIVSLRENVLSRYRFIYIWRMNDILGKSPREGSIPWETLYEAHLVWEDRNSPVSEGGYGNLPRFAGGVKFVTHTLSDFEWNLNLTNITMERSGPETVKLYLDTVCPNFARFDIFQSNVAAKAGNVIELKPPFDFVSVACINSLGMRGRFSNFQIVQ